MEHYVDRLLSLTKNIRQASEKRSSLFYHSVRDEELFVSDAAKNKLECLSKFLWVRLELSQVEIFTVHRSVGRLLTPYPHILDKSGKNALAYFLHHQCRRQFICQ